MKTIEKLMRAKKDFRAHIDRQYKVQLGLQDEYYNLGFEANSEGDKESAQMFKELLHDTDIRVKVLRTVLQSFDNIIEDEDKNEPADKYYRVGSECVYEGEAHKELLGLVGHIRAVFKWEVLVEFDVEDTDELWPVYRLPKDDVIPF